MVFKYTKQAGKFLVERHNTTDLAKRCDGMLRAQDIQEWKNHLFQENIRGKKLAPMVRPVPLKLIVR